MPKLRKLSQEEVTEITEPKPSTRQKIANEYDGMLDGFEVGDYGEVGLAEGDNRLTIRGRLIAAAKRRELNLSFHRTSGDMLRFEVIEPHVEPPVEQKPAGKKRGRPPRAAS